MTQADRVGSPDKRDSLLAQEVGARVRTLQKQYLAGAASAAALLAQLRRGLQREPGSVAEIWEATIGILDESLLGRGDAPSAWERSAHAAMTLYALHQQSQRKPMHRPRQSLGTAVRDLRRLEGRQTGDVDPILRRFQALVTAPSMSETTHHLRGLVTLMRGAGVPIDYAALARDLRQLQSPVLATDVRLRWGRALYASTVAAGEPASPAESASTPPNTRDNT